MSDQPQPRNTDNYVNLITTPVHALVKRAPITLSPETTIVQAAQLMRDQRVSSVVIEQHGALFGIVTDRDLRNRVLAAGLDPQRSIVEIATLAPLTIDIHSHAFDALLLMARHNIHHVPVMDGDAIAGMITTTDLTEQQSNSAVYLAGAVYKQTTVAGLIETSTRIKKLQQNLAAAEASAYSTGHIVSAITDALTSRLLQLGELEFGPPPIDYAWVAAGSQGRNEQTAKSDQDNCLILDDAYHAPTHGEYFQQLAQFVCDGLDACGYVYCPGDIMAMTDQWRQPKAKWHQYFHRWIDQPDPTALLMTSVFFDQRFVYGKRELLDDLRADVLARTPSNRLFVAHMAGNATAHSPPLNWLGHLSLIKKGAYAGTIDLKHAGIVPITDLARVYSLAGGSPAVNTKDRLDNAASSGEISEQCVRDLLDALEYLSTLRIQHQARRMSDGHAADNYLRPEELSNFERGHLKEAFGVVKSLQSALANRYPMNR